VAAVPTPQSQVAVSCRELNQTDRTAREARMIVSDNGALSSPAIAVLAWGGEMGWSGNYIAPEGDAERLRRSF